MKSPTIRTALLAAIVAIATCAAGSVAAHGGRVHFGITLGYPGWWYYPPPYYYPPVHPYYYDPYYYPGAPYASGNTTYIEQSAPETPAQPQEQWWYYCEPAKAYYPYVRECASGWKRVSPTPPPGS